MAKVTAFRGLLKYCGQATGLRQHLRKLEPLSCCCEEIAPILPSLLPKDFTHKTTCAIWELFDKFYLRGRELIIILGKMIGSCQVNGGHEKYKRLF